MKDKKNNTNIVEMTQAQKSQWFLYEAEPESPFYLNIIALNITGTIIVPCIKAALHKLILKHDLLRTKYMLYDNKLCQVIYDDNDEVEIKELDLRNDTQLERNKKLKNYQQKEANLPIDLKNDFPIRISIIRLEDSKIQILFTLHHIMSDGWSVKVILQDFSSIYTDILKFGTSKNDTLNFNYSDYATSEKEFFASDEFENQLAYWKNKLKGDLTYLDLPKDNKVEWNQKHIGQTKELIFDESMMKRINDICLKYNCTKYMISLAAFSIFLSLYTAEDDILFGTVVSNRNRDELQNLVGFFANTVPFRISNINKLTIEELINETKNLVIEMADNQNVPFDILTSRMRIHQEKSRNPLFGTLLVYQNSLVQKVNIEGINFDLEVLTNETSKFDLSLQIFEEQNKLFVRFEYNNTFFNSETIEKWQREYKCIVENIIKYPTKKIQDCSIISEDEENMILTQFNNTCVNFPSEKNIVEIFDEIAQKYPDKPAVIYEEERITYNELYNSSYRIACGLKCMGIRPEDCIAIAADKNIETIKGILGILRAGGTYVPVEMGMPNERINYILKSCNAKLVLSKEMLFAVEELPVKNIKIDDLDKSTKVYNGLDKKIEPTSLAYVMYTSGSTGNPKGVMITHRNVIRLVKNSNFLDFNNINILQAGSLAFDASTFEIWGSLLNAGCLFLISKENLLNIKRIKKVLYENKIDALFLTVSLFNQLILDDKTLFDKVKALLVGGDKLSEYHINLLRKHNHEIKIINGYGPTEGTTFTTTYNIEDVSNNIPIGKPIANTQVYIMRNNTLCSIGMPGELCIAGDGVAKGYLNQPELTKKVFIKNPYGKGLLYKSGDIARWRNDGNIEFIGRKDGQVKIRGFRIELKEIEYVVKEFNDIEDAVVVENDKKLYAYYVSNQNVNEEKLKEFLAKKLPSYMIPKFMEIKKIPLNQNGKVDKSKLPEYKNTTDEFIFKARNDKDTIMIEAFENVLDNPSISIKDCFFELGGDSIKAIRVLSFLRNKGYDVELKYLLSDYTIEDISDNYLFRKEVNYITYNQNEISGEVQLSPIQQQFFQWKLPKPNHFNFSTILTCKEFREEFVTKAFEKIVEHHDSLRSIFKNNKQVILGMDKSAKFEFELFEDTEIKEENITKSVSELQKSFDICTGPLIKLALYKTSTTDYLFICIHHLVVDAISWSIIIEDFINSYQQLEQGNEEIILPLKTMSFKEWTELLWKYNKEGYFESEVKYWKQQCRKIHKIQM